ncbi:MAG: Lrp/AsnC ligand binding domain-containing protein [Lentisphaeria bacterium]|nr:Lrp/AsnC ligand binding domain-containing protein [Lentisphaeria bacterium]
MVTGIVLVNVDRPMLRQAINGIFALPGVTEVYTVAGEYDLVVMIRVGSNAELADVIATKMTHDIPGIRHTKTLISLNADAKVDLKAVFGGK